MEVSTVSPHPASPTGGDNLCEPDVTTMAIHSVTLLICLCGLAGNGAVLCLLRLRGNNFVIYSMAVIDFFSLLLTVPSALLLLVEDLSCSSILPMLYLRFLFRLSLLSCYWVPLSMTFLSLAVLMENFWKLCCHRDLSGKLIWVLVIVQFWAFSALFTEIPALTSHCQLSDQEHCRAALIAVWTIILILIVAPMTFLLISSSIDLIKAKWGSRQQQPDGYDIVTVPVGLFNLLFFICNFLQELGFIVVPSHFFFLLACINNSINPFIYFLVGRCWRPSSVGSLRLSLQRVFEEPEENTAHSHDSTMDTGV